MTSRFLPLALASTLLVGFLGTGPLSAQDALRLKPEATISGDVVRLDHLIEGLGEKGRIAVFRAPQPGHRGTIRAERVLEAARDMGIHGVETGEIAAVQITRPGRSISREDMQQAVSRVAIERGTPGHLDVVIDDHHSARMVDASRSEPIKVATFHRDMRSGRFEARLSLPGAPDGMDGWTVTGSIVEIREVAVPIHDIERGEAIQASDVVLVKRPASAVGSDIVRPLAELIGMVPRRPLKAGEMIRSSDLAKPILVEKQAMVTVTYAGRGMTLTMRGRALGSGSHGDSIKVQNLQSKKVVEGIISGPAHVTIAGPIAPQASLSEAATRR